MPNSKCGNRTDEQTIEEQIQTVKQWRNELMEIAWNEMRKSYPFLEEE